MVPPVRAFRIASTRKGIILMASAVVRQLNHQPARGANEHAVNTKIATSDFDVLAALAVVDRTNTAEQIRRGVSIYFTYRMRDHTEMARKIAAARSRHEATLAVISGKATSIDDEPTPAPAHSDSHHLDRPVTLRVDSQTLDMLTAFALIDRVTMADVLRAGIGYYLALRKADPELSSDLDTARRRYERDLTPLRSSL